MDFVGLLRRACYLPVALLLAALGYRVARPTHPERIGHLVTELDCLLKQEAMGEVPHRRLLTLLPADRIANQAVVDYWRRHAAVVSSPLLCRLAQPLLYSRFTRLETDITRYAVAIDKSSEGIRIQRAWGERPPLLKLTARDMERGEAALRELGVAPGQRFVCLHSRDGGYSPGDEHLHSFRNTSIERYAAAAKALAARGLTCIRLGDPRMRPMAAAPGIVDYAHSALRADWLDVFLAARCEFFLGNTSGLYFLASVFGVPCALTNLVPPAMVLATGNARDLGIPKLLWHEHERRYLDFREVFAGPIANARFAEQYEKVNLRPVENEPEEIRDLALEMLDRCRGQARYSEEDEALQIRFKALLRPGHYTYGSASRVGRDFLRKYASLLDD